MGAGWRMNYERYVDVWTTTYGTRVIVSRPNGTARYFTVSGTTYLSDPDEKGRLVSLLDGSGAASGWQYYTPDNQVETYDANGRLLAIADSHGNQQSLIYNGSGQLVSVIDPAGRALVLTYTPAGRIGSVIDPGGGQHSYGYDEDGNLVSVLFPDGSTKQYLYENDVVGHGLTGIIDENGSRYATYTYNDTGIVTAEEHAGGVNRYSGTFAGSFATVIDPLGTSRTFGFSYVGGVRRLASVSQPCGSCGAGDNKSLTYDANGNVKERTDFNGVRTSYTYDLSRNLEISRTEALFKPEQRKITTQWHPDFRLPTAIAEPKRRTTLTYDANGNLLTRTIQETNDANGSQGFSATLIGSPRTWTYTYTTTGDGTLAGLLKAVDGPRTDLADLTAYSYLPNGDLASISNALGQITHITARDAHGRPTTVVDPNGLVTTLTYDVRGRLVSRDVGSEVTSYAYDAVGQLERVTLPGGSFLRYTYDPAHRLIAIADNVGNRIEYTLDAIGNRIKEDTLDPQGALAQTRSRVFDALNRLAQDIGAAGQTTSYGYDAQGNLTSVTDPLNRVTANAYDSLGRLIRVTDPGLNQTLYGYDGLDRLTRVTDPRNLVTQYAIDGLGNLNQQTSPDTGVTTKTYDVAGNILTGIDAKGQTTTYAYDALNRVVSAVYADGSGVAYVYDQGTNGVGRLASATETDPQGAPTFRIDYGYDLKGRVVSETRTLQGTAHLTQYSYDAAGRLVGTVYPGGRAIEYQLDALGRIAQVATTNDGLTQVLASNIQYRAFGGVQSLVLGNGQPVSRTYDYDGRIVSFTLGNQNIALTWDAGSRITAITDPLNPTQDRTYGYDALDRLTGYSAQPVTQSFTYDPVGNRLGTTGSSGSESYSYSPTSNRLLSISGATARVYGYDANGAVASDGVNSFAYDAKGRMSSAAGAGGSAAYQISALGQRVMKQLPEATTVFHYDREGRIIAESDAAGNVMREYLWLDEFPIAYFDGTSLYYVHSDHLGTPRLLAGGTGAAVWRWEGPPFGEGAADQDPDGNGVQVSFNLRFPGQYFDKETGTHYNYFRDYDPGIGRYVQSDPIGLRGGVNTYAYVRGNPVSLSDSLGLYTEVIQWGPSPRKEGSWGHISGNINGTNWSFGPRGWDKTYPSAEDYANRQSEPEIDRGGRGVILDLSPAEEILLARCLASFRDYSGVRNNCGNPWVRCLERIGVATAQDKPRVIPYDVYRIISNSPRVIGNTNYPGSRPPVGAGQ